MAFSAASLTNLPDAVLATDRRLLKVWQGRVRATPPILLALNTAAPHGNKFARPGGCKNAHNIPRWFKARRRAHAAE